MGHTMVEKILAKASGQQVISAGQTVRIKPDLIMMYDWQSISDYVLDIVDKDLGKGDLLAQRGFVMFIDHKIPATAPHEQAFHNATIEWCNRRGIPVYQGGIGHQMAVDMGLVKPGNVAVHFDRHINILGALGAFSVGTRLELIMALATGRFAIQVPETLRVNITGSFSPGVMGRDLVHRLVGDYGPDGAPDQVIEFGGPGAAGVSMDSRLCVCCLAMMLGATTAMFEPDAVTRQFLGNQDDSAGTWASDPDCRYARVIDFDLSSLEPQIVRPPNLQDTVPLRKVEGTIVRQGYIGSCASGRLEDLRIAAKILHGRKVAKGFRLHVVPSSARVMAESSRLGYLATLVEAGAWVSSPTCDYCYGKAQTLADGEAAISTGTLNVPGRMGNVKSDIYLGSAASVAACAVSGAIADPRQYVTGGGSE